MTGEKAYPRIDGVVLEIKFTNRFPVWMREMARAMNLDRRSMAKYVACMAALKAPGLQLMGHRDLLAHQEIMV